MTTPRSRLVALVETLQKRKLRHNKRPQSQPHALENITIALDAIQEDGIKLVNIGKYTRHPAIHSGFLSSPKDSDCRLLPNGRNNGNQTIQIL